MKPKRLFEPHLSLTETVLPAGSELSLHSPGWYFLQVKSGVGYWLHPRANFELVTGGVIVFSGCAQGVVRASQVNQFVAHVFRVQPDRLTGLVSFGEQQFLQKAATQDSLAARSFSPATPIAAHFKDFRKHSNGSSLRARLQMLQLFIEAFGNELQKYKPGPEPPVDAKTRLTRLLEDTPISEVLNLSFSDLVRETRCTPRHLSRVFQKVVGMSFREKQAQLRLLRAQELLATTESKVVDVALESGYQSPCLFNLMFKRNFGVTPAKWRDQSRKRALVWRPEPRPSLLQAKGEPLAIVSS